MDRASGYQPKLDARGTTRRWSRDVRRLWQARASVNRANCLHGHGGVSRVGILVAWKPEWVSLHGAVGSNAASAPSTAGDHGTTWQRPLGGRTYHAASFRTLLLALSDHD